MDTRAMALEAYSRSNLYGLLARIYRAEVDSDLLAEFRKPEVVEALKEAGVDLTMTLSAPDDTRLLEELATSYTYLFLLTLSPHESVARGEGQLWGKHTVAANEFMEEIGLAMAEDRSLLADHIATELEVMQHLTAEEAAALEAGDQPKADQFRALQVRYMKEHLGAWAVGFLGSAERLATHEFYRQIAVLSRGFLFGETQMLT